MFEPYYEVRKTKLIVKCIQTEINLVELVENFMHFL